MHIDLSDVSGLPIALDLDSCRAIATGDVHLGELGERRLSHLRGVLADPEAVTEDRVCYLMYRGVGTRNDLELLGRHGLRYDITVILPGLVGREFVKTAGHYHSTAPDGVAYPEIYEVLQGSAAFVFQFDKRNEISGWVQLAEASDRIVIPPNCGHVTVNIGRGPLVVSDLVAVACTNDYGAFRAAKGAANYIVEDNGRFAVEANRRYNDVAVAAVTTGSGWPAALPDGAPLLELFRRKPNAFDWLTAPASFEDEIWGAWGIVR
ncbi:MAG: glucose-6-phosphate isomerase family protein [Thermomicrobiales bacterium]